MLCYESKRIAMLIAFFHLADYWRSPFSFCRKNSRLSLEAQDYLSHTPINIARIQFHSHTMIYVYYTIDTRENEGIY